MSGWPSFFGSGKGAAAAVWLLGFVRERGRESFGFASSKGAAAWEQKRKDTGDWSSGGGCFVFCGQGWRLLLLAGRGESLVLQRGVGFGR